MHKLKKNSSILVNNTGSIVQDISSLRVENHYIVRQVRNLTDKTFVVRFDRNDMEFKAGQHITLGLEGDNQIREYSIYSATNQPFLEVLIREVEEGSVSKKLHRIKEGDRLKVEGPFGFFTPDESKIPEWNYLFIATGTGIAPFHSIVGSYPQLNYKILHGVRFVNEGYERNSYHPGKYLMCSSQDKDGDFYGRVTDYLSIHDEVQSNTLVYLCGNYEMIYQVYNILTTKGINPDQIKTEVYF